MVTNLRWVAFGNASGYLSQSSGVIVISPDVKQIELFEVKGEQTRTISY